MSTHPNFEILLPGGATTTGAVFGYSVQASGRDRHSLRISISAEIMAKTTWTAATRLRLDIDDKARQGRLAVVAEGSHQARKLSVIPATNRGLFSFPWSGKCTDLFPMYDAVCEMDVIAATPDDVIFELPENTYAEGEAPQA
jgi:hypothetical protein